VDDADIETLAETKTRVAHCPKSNSNWSRRVAAREVFRAGITVSLGSDSVASNNVCDLLEEARYALLLALQEVQRRSLIFSASDVLQLATRGGAQALGMPEQSGALARRFAGRFSRSFRSPARTKFQFTIQLARSFSARTRVTWC